MKHLDEEMESFLDYLAQRIVKMKMRQFQQVVSETVIVSGLAC